MDYGSNDPTEAMKGDLARAQGAAAAEHPARGQVRQQVRDLVKTLASLETEACRRIALEQALERAVMVGYRAASKGPFLTPMEDETVIMAYQDFATLLNRMGRDPDARVAWINAVRWRESQGAEPPRTPAPKPSK